uniref:Uncharacterized protein n=1 Tax=Pipistrellus kuhlii TaxID=59472 RepID=A0A7J7X0I5_PIPKU|nr:hypothetical protein mPipKuh1_010817 [Pipistrellus kuhlii]
MAAPGAAGPVVAAVQREPGRPPNTDLPPRTPFLDPCQVLALPPPQPAPQDQIQQKTAPEDFNPSSQPASALSPKWPPSGPRGPSPASGSSRSPWLAPRRPCRCHEAAQPAEMGGGSQDGGGW